MDKGWPASLFKFEQILFSTVSNFYIMAFFFELFKNILKTFEAEEQ